VTPCEVRRHRGGVLPYDPLGRRTHKSGTGVTERYFLDDGDDEIAEYTAAGAIYEHYVPGAAIDEPIAEVNGGATVYWYFHTNHQGSVIAMSGGGGGVTAGPYTYDPYGNCFDAGNACSSGEPYRFTGRRLDAETGLYYYRARYYWPGGGRFLQTDPVGYTADLNLYTYVGNDPVDMTDPYGEAGDQNCITDNNGTTCQPVETVVVTAQRPPQPKQDLRSPMQRAGAIAMPLPTVGGAARAAIPAVGVLGPAAVVVGTSSLLCGDSPCGPTKNEAKAKPPRADKGKERGKKDAQRQLRTNQGFRDWFHKNYKGGPGGQSIPAGGARNPNMSDEEVQDAWEEYQDLGGK